MSLVNQRRKVFFVTLGQIVARFGDGHGIVSVEVMYHLPIRAEFVENEIVIIASNDMTLERGDIIKKLDGEPVMKVLHETEKTISGSPQLRRYRTLNILGRKLDPGETDLVFERDGKEYLVSCSNTNNGKNIFFNPID